MNVGAATEADGLPVRTVRHYEGIGLASSDRKTNSHRDYSDRHVRRLHFVRRARSLGFSVEDCRRLPSLHENGGRADADVKNPAREHLEGIERKIAELTDMRDALGRLVNSCRGDNRPDCPIIDRPAN